PQYDNEAKSSVQDITGQTFGSSHACNTVSNQSTTGASLSQTFACMKELSKWNVDPEKNQIERKIQTHMVAFYLDDVVPKMREVTNEGDGMTVRAENADQLAEAFTSSVNSITQNAP